MGIVYMFKESEIVLALYLWERTAEMGPTLSSRPISRNINSLLKLWWFSRMTSSNYGFYPISTTDYSFLTDYDPGYEIKVEIG